MFLSNIFNWFNRFFFKQKPKDLSSTAASRAELIDHILVAFPNTTINTVDRDFLLHEVTPREFSKLVEKHRLGKKMIREIEADKKITFNEDITLKRVRKQKQRTNEIVETELRRKLKIFCEFNQWKENRIKKDKTYTDGDIKNVHKRIFQVLEKDDDIQSGDDKNLLIACQELLEDFFTFKINEIKNNISFIDRLFGIEPEIIKKMRTLKYIKEKSHYKIDSTNHDLQRELEEANGKIVALQEGLTEAASTIEVLSKEIRAKDEAIKLLEDQLEENDFQMIEHEKKIKEKDEKIKEQDEKIKEQDEKIKELNSNIETLKKRCELRQQKINQLLGRTTKTSSSLPNTIGHAKNPQTIYGKTAQKEDEKINKEQINSISNSIEKINNILKNTKSL